jgi:hypothetical protein
MGYDLGDVCDKLDDVCGRLDDVESAVKDNKPSGWSSGWTLWFLFCFLFLGPIIGGIWDSVVYSRARYYFQYNAELSNIIIHPKPYDCWFWSAPLGRKGCRYERAVTSVRVRPDLFGGQSVSYDEGKTWIYLLPPDRIGGRRETPSVDVGWVKKDDDE